MARRRVTKSEKDSDGDITGVCGPEYYYRAKWGVIEDITAELHEYYVSEAGYESTVHVYEQNGVQHIKTFADASSANNLDNLPDC